MYISLFSSTHFCEISLLTAFTAVFVKSWGVIPVVRSRAICIVIYQALNFGGFFAFMLPCNGLLVFLASCISSSQIWTTVSFLSLLIWSLFFIVSLFLQHFDLPVLPFPELFLVLRAFFLLRRCLLVCLLTCLWSVCLIFHQIRIGLLCSGVLWHSRRNFGNLFACNWTVYILRRWRFFSRLTVVVEFFDDNL